jgi:hypothetical protein
MCFPKITMLKEEVERIFGRKVLNASDCLLLSKDIYDQTQSTISINTLRRIFNIMKSKYQASLFTLDLMSKYCGFTSYSEFVSREERPANSAGQQDSSLLDFLILLFRDADLKSLDETSYCSLIHTTISKLEQWPDVINSLQCRIAKTDNGQKLYFEKFINIDKLNSYYGEGLRYYLLETRKPEAQLFGHSLLCYSSWLTGNHEAVKKHFLKVTSYNIDEANDMFVCGRYFATRLFHADVVANDFEPILDKAIEFFDSSNMKKNAAKSFPGFEFIMAETLILLHQYNDALFYINEAIKKRNNQLPANINSKLFESLYLFKATALFHTGKIEKAKEIFDTIGTCNFNFLSKQYNTILYLLLKKQIEKRGFHDKQISYLVQQTGFSQLSPNTVWLKKTG